MESTKSNDPKGKVNIRILEAILRENLKDNQLKIINMTSGNLCAIGDNFTSVVVKLEAQILRGSSKQKEVLHLVAKTIKYMTQKIMNWSVVLEKEIFAYNVLIPMYKDLERDAGIAENDLIDCVPEYAGHRYTLKIDSNEVDEESMLVLKNLETDGYYVQNRKQGLDIQHATIVLTSLARFHALGVVLRQKRPKDFEKVKLQAAKNGYNFDMLMSGYLKILQIFREESCFTKYISKIENCYEYRAKNPILEATEPWITIAHADTRTNNILFHKDDNGIIDDVKFIDFQIYAYCSPAVDLTYFLHLSLDQDCFDQLDELLDVYYNKFIDTLKCMGCDHALFTRESLDLEYKKYSRHTFPTNVLNLKYLFYEVSKKDTDDKDIVVTIMNSEPSKVWKDKVMRLIEIYEEKGWF